MKPLFFLALFSLATTSYAVDNTNRGEVCRSVVPRVYNAIVAPQADVRRHPDTVTFKVDSLLSQGWRLLAEVEVALNKQRADYDHGAIVGLLIEDGEFKPVMWYPTHSNLFDKRNENNEHDPNCLAEYLEVVTAKYNLRAETHHAQK